MRCNWIFGVLALAVAHPAIAETNGSVAQSMTDFDMLVRLNAERLDAYRTRDRAALDRILAEDFVAVRGNGMSQSKTALIAAATSPVRDIRSVSWDNVQIHVRGDTAIVTGRSYLEGTSEGRDISNASQYADVYVRRSGEWKIIAARITRTSPGASPQ